MLLPNQNRSEQNSSPPASPRVLEGLKWEHAGACADTETTPSPCCQPFRSGEMETRPLPSIHPPAGPLSLEKSHTLPVPGLTV